MKVLLEFGSSHHYFKEYAKTEWFCPNCGEQDLWEERGPGDYYMGTESLCLSCGFGCYLHNGPAKIEEAAYVSVIEQLRTGIAKEPSTKPGV